MSTSSPAVPPTADTLNAERTASAILLLARTLGSFAESSVRGALVAARPDVMAKIGPTDPPDPGAAPSS